MTDGPRALLTDGEKDALRGADDMNENTRNSHKSRVRKKLPKMIEDARFLREHAPNYADILEEGICEPTAEERLERLERRLNHLERNADFDAAQNTNTTNATDPPNR